VLTEEQGRRPWRRHDGAATVAAARPPSRGYDSKGAASCSWPSVRAQHGDDVGVADCHPIDVAVKSHRKHPGARTEAPARPTGADRAARARSTERSSAAMAAIGGEDDESTWSGGSTRRGRAHAPKGGGRARRSSPESGEELVGDSESLEGIRVRNRPRGGASEGAAGWAEPDRSSPLGLTDRWAQAVSPAFYLI
jgi:hypothetical protein